MIERPLTEEEELLGDQIAALFYQEPSGTLVQSIATILKERTTDDAELILDATLSRLYSERTARRNYLAGQLSLPKSSPSEQDTKLLDLTSGDTSSFSPELLEQLEYFRAVTLNLTGYEVEKWQERNKYLFAAITRLPEDKVAKLEQSLGVFVKTFYQSGTYQALDQIAIPPSLQSELEAADIAVGLNRYETIVQKATYLVFVWQLCQLLLKLRAEEVSEAEVATGLGLGTLSFRKVLAETS